MRRATCPGAPDCEKSYMTWRSSSEEPFRSEKKSNCCPSVHGVACFFVTCLYPCSCFFNSDYSFCTLCMHCFIWSKRGHSLNTSVHFLFPVKKIQDYTELLFEPNTTTSINQKSVQYFLYLKFSSASLLRCDIS